VKIQTEKNYREGRENSLVCRSYSEFVKLSNVYNLSGSIGLDQIAFSSISQRINILRVITNSVGHADLHTA